MDVTLVSNLETFLADFLANDFGDGFSGLAPDSIDPVDLGNWWFRIHEIVKGEVPLEELPEYLRDAASKYI